MLAVLPANLFAAAFQLNGRSIRMEQFLGGLAVYVVVILLVLWYVWQSRFWRTVVLSLVLVKVVAITAIALYDSGRPAARPAPGEKAVPAAPSGAGRTPAT
jgi:hypothetical protein